MLVKTARTQRNNLNKKSSKSIDKPVFRIWSLPRNTGQILLFGLEKIVHFLTRGRFLPHTRRKARKWRGPKNTNAYDSKEDYGMFLALRPSALRLMSDMNNNAVPTDITNKYMDSFCAEEEEIPNWVLRCLIPDIIRDPIICEDPSWFSLEMRTMCEQLPLFLPIVPDKARQNIGDWLTSDPGLMISIPMIPKLIPGDRLGLIFQYGGPINLSTCCDESRETYFGFLLEPNSTEMHAVAITFYRRGHGLRDVDILREAGMMQHINHKHVMPKFFGMAVVEASTQYCQWVTVMEYMDKDTAAPIDLPTFVNSEIIRRTYFFVSSQRWFDWINLARTLLQNLHLIHTEGIVFGDLDMDRISVNKTGLRHRPCIINFKNACYGDYSTKTLLGGLPREPLAACAHGCDDIVLSKNMDPCLSYDAHVTQHHDLFSYGYIIRKLGNCLFVPELENLGVRIMQSRQQDRSEGGALSAECIISELRALTFRAGGSRSMCCPLDCYELARQLQKRTRRTGTLFSIYPDLDDVNS